MKKIKKGSRFIPIGLRERKTNRSVMIKKRFLIAIR